MRSLVFVHGYLGGSAQWADQVEAFSPSFQVITPDLPGFGNHSDIPAPDSIGAFADYLLEQLRAQGVERFDLVGHFLQKEVSLLEGQVAVRDHLVEQDLDVHLVVGTADTAGIVDEVRVHASRAAGELYPCELGQPQVPAFAHDAAAEHRGGDPQVVVAGGGRLLHLGRHVEEAAGLPLDLESEMDLAALVEQLLALVGRDAELVA